MSEASGATYRQIDYWARTGLVVPSVAQARGEGTKRIYSFEDVILCRLVVVLSGDGRGRDLPRGGGIGSLVREALAIGESGWFLAIPAGGPPIVTCEPAAVIAEAHTVVTLVDLDAVRHHVTAALRSTENEAAGARTPDGLLTR